MIIEQTTKFKLERQSRKIFKMSPVINGFLYVSSVKKCVEKLIHINKEGKILWERDYVNSVDTFGILSDREAVVMNVSKSTIEFVNLLTYQVKSYPHNYIFDYPAPMDIFVFPDSKLFTIVENKSILSITYYSYQNQDIKKVAVFESENFSSFEPQKLWNNEMNFTQMNNRSKFAWWDPRQSNTIQFYTFDLESCPEGKLSLISLQNTLMKDYDIKNLSIEIENMWETEPDVYMMVCNSNRPDKDPDNAVNNNYILDVKKEILRETKFKFPGKWNRMLADYYSLGEISVFHTFYFNKGLPLSSLIYYVHNQREEIIATESWQATCMTNMFAHGFKSSTVILTKFSTGYINEVEVTTKQYLSSEMYQILYNLHEIYLHFMLHINEEFDDDLLHDAIKLLTDRE